MAEQKDLKDLIREELDALDPITVEAIFRAVHERKHQIEKGYDLAHDIMNDEKRPKCLIDAAICYVVNPQTESGQKFIEQNWPYDKEFYVDENESNNFVKSVAMMLAQLGVYINRSTPSVG